MRIIGKGPLGSLTLGWLSIFTTDDISIVRSSVSWLHSLQQYDLTLVILQSHL